MSAEVNERVFRAKTDESELDSLIKDHKNFIMANAYKSCGHFVTENDDEWSVSLIAFHEAVKTFDETKGDFHAFAALVIKRRIVDYIRGQSKYGDELSVDPEMLGGEIDDDSSDKATGMKIRDRISEESQREAIESDSQSDAKMEIEAVGKILSEYGFTFFDLADSSPKAEKTKKMCARAVGAMLDAPELITELRNKKTLPVKDICKNALVPRKILERHRKYIIAAAEILTGDFPILAEYMKYIKEEVGK